MSTPSRFVNQALLFGGLACLLVASAFADPQVVQSSTTTTTTTTAPTGGYYDHSGLWHTGVAPFAGGWYDQQGLWHTQSSTTTTTTLTSTGYDEPLTEDRYNTNYHNYYAGYGSMLDINRGFVNVRGADGSLHEVSLKDNRTMVRLCADNTLEPKLDMDRGFDRGVADYPVSTFDPQMLVIPTGQHVTFYSDEGAHTIQPQDGHSLTQSVIITPGVCYNWTFTEPGLYRFEDSFGGGPTEDRLQGLFIRVTGDSVAFDDSMFCDALIPYQSVAINTTMEETAVQVPAPVVQTDTTVTQETPTTVVQGQQPAQPVKPQPKKVLRNKDIK